MHVCPISCACSCAQFCFLLNLLSIPAGLFDVAFAAADADGSGTIDLQELQKLVKVRWMSRLVCSMLYTDMFRGAGVGGGVGKGQDCDPRQLRNT